MAGIGFELKKLFAKKGVLNSAKALGYAAVICTGPMLLGVLLLFGITALCIYANTELHTREILISMITYTMLASVTVSSFFSMVVTLLGIVMFVREVQLLNAEGPMVVTLLGMLIFVRVLLR